MPAFFIEYSVQTISPLISSSSSLSRAFSLPEAELEDPDASFLKLEAALRFIAVTATMRTKARIAMPITVKVSMKLKKE